MRKNNLIISFMILIICTFFSSTAVYATEDATRREFSEPKVMVTSYEIVDGKISNGEEFTINVEISNVNQYTTAYNVAVAMISANNNVVMVDEKSNLIYFDVIEAGETKEFTMDLKMLDLENDGLAVVAFMTTCYNKQGNAYSEESRLTLTAEEQAQLEVSAITISKNAVVGANALVSVRYANVGGARLSNIKMKIEGNIEESQKIKELGILEAGSQKYSDYYVTFTEAGEQTLNISFEYQDKLGNIHELNAAEYCLKVYPYVVSAENELVVDTEKIQLGMKEIYMLIAGSILIIILLAVGIRFVLNAIRKHESR